MAGAGFWAEEWVDEGDSTGVARGCDVSMWARARRYLGAVGPPVTVSDAGKSLMTDCLPPPFMYSPVQNQAGSRPVTTRSVAFSGTGNGGSFLRTSAVRTWAAITRFMTVSSAAALTQVTGPGGESQKSADDR